MNVDISGKIIVITGSSRGIGSELARFMATEGANVCVNYNKSQSYAEQLRKSINVYNKNCLFVKADVSNASDVKKFYQEVLSYYGRIDVLINNAGICDDNLIQMMTMEQWENVLNTNLSGTFLCCKEFSKLMINQKSGKIINIASLKGQEGCIGQANYSASKAGIIGLTKTLAKELGRHNISVNAICPGFIVTDLNRHNAEKKIIAQNRSTLDTDRALEDLMSFVAFLCSDKMLGTSGRIFNLDSRIN